MNRDDRPLVVVIGSIGFAFDGVTLFIRLLAPGVLASRLPNEYERRLARQREYRRKQTEARRVAS